MTTDEAVAVAREESARLRYKAANLRDRQKVVMAAQEERIADTIDVLLADRERLRGLIVAWEADLAAPTVYLNPSARALQAEARAALAGKARP